MTNLRNAALTAAVAVTVALASASAVAADGLKDTSSRTDPSLPTVPWLRDGFPEGLDVPIHKELPLPGGQALRLDTPVPKAKLAEWKARFRSGQALRYFFIDIHNRDGRYRKGPGLTGDEFRQVAESGRLPVQELGHVEFIYGFLWQNVRRYYVAYRLSGDPFYIEQIVQYARAMDGVLADHPEAFIPKDKREAYKQKGITVDMLPYEPAGGSNLMAHAYSAMLAMEWVKAHPDGPRAAEWTRLATRNLNQVARYTPSLLGNQAHPDTGLPVHVHDWLHVLEKYSPWNQCYMTFGMLTAAALAMEDYQAVADTAAYQPTIDRYLTVVRAGNAALTRDSETCILGGKPYLFMQHGPAFLPEHGNRGYHFRGLLNGHPLFVGGEDIPHSGSTAWNLLFIWENAGDRAGATDALCAALINALVDYVMGRPVKDDKGNVYPPNHFYSPWTQANVPEKNRTLKWFGRLGKIGEGYDGYVVWTPDFRMQMAKWKIRRPRQDLFVHFAKRVYQVAAARNAGATDLPLHCAP